MIETKRPIVVIDGMNTFVRHFCVNPTVSASGEMIGGVVGFIKFIEWITINMSPQKIVVVWEKGGGCPRRKAIYPEYKANRAKIKDIESATSNKTPRIMDNIDSKQKQLVMLVGILKHLPVCQVFQPECECDDIIAYIVNQKLSGSPEKKIVISNDKDFYQLLIKDDVVIYDTAKKNYVTAQDVVDKFNIHPKNFVLARTLDGDSSDNITGVKGVGMITLKNAIPEITDQEKELDIDILMELCKQKSIEKPKVKIYKTILESEEIIRRNWQLMYLGLSSVKANVAIKINQTLDNFVPSYDHLNFLKSLQKDDIVLPIDFGVLASQLKLCLLTSS